MTQLRVSHLSDPRQFASSINGALRRTDPLSLSSDQTALEVDRNLTLSGAYQINGVQVLGARITGWAADTGTSKKTANATYTAPTISNPPTQAEVQAIADKLQDVSRTMKALKADLFTHGIIGT